MKAKVIWPEQQPPTDASAAGFWSWMTTFYRKGRRSMTPNHRQQWAIAAHLIMMFAPILLLGFVLAGALAPHLGQAVPLAPWIASVPAVAALWVFLRLKTLGVWRHLSPRALRAAWQGWFTRSTAQPGPTLVIAVVAAHVGASVAVGMGLFAGVIACAMVRAATTPLLGTSAVFAPLGAGVAVIIALVIIDRVRRARLEAGQ